MNRPLLILATAIAAAVALAGIVAAELAKPAVSRPSAAWTEDSKGNVFVKDQAALDPTARPKAYQYLYVKGPGTLALTATLPDGSTQAVSNVILDAKGGATQIMVHVRVGPALPADEMPKPPVEAKP